MGTRAWLRKYGGIRNPRHHQSEDRTSFAWPSTEAPPGFGRVDDPDEWPAVGILRHLGYQVGQNGLLTRRRREILDSAYGKDLPHFGSSTYMMEWSAPRTARRLQKLAESLAAFARNAKRRTHSDLSQAISDWENDLEYLRMTYYVGHYDFAWPTTSVA